MTLDQFLAGLLGAAVTVGLIYLSHLLTTYDPPRRWPMAFKRQPLTLLDAQPGDVIVATQAERYFPLSYAAHMREIQYLHYNPPPCTTPVQVSVGDALVVQGWSLDPVLLPAFASRADRAGADCQLVATHPRTGQTIYIWPLTGCGQFDLQETGQ